ncbi:MAG: hypothetical protein H6Q17_530 [Bacteroidetes bacterium]|nr:hypothetical protein [Bacteroidota bacterium]
MDKIEERKEELERADNAKMIEAGAIALEVGDEEEFVLRDIQALQRVRTRMARLGLKTGRSYYTKVKGNTITIRRGA